MHICLVTARVPPANCGVGDHTIHLALAMQRTGHQVTVVTSQKPAFEPPFPAAQDITVRNLIPRWDLLGSQALVHVVNRLAPDLVVLQWVPSLYSARGMSPWLPAAASILAGQGRRVHTMVHEPWVALDRWQHFISGPVQRASLGILVRASSAILVSTHAWTSMLKETFPWKTQAISWVPVGSNIVVGTAPAIEAATGPVLGVFSPLGAGKGRALIMEAWRRASVEYPQARLVMLGVDAEDGTAAFPGLAAPGRVTFTGYLAAADVSRWLHSMDVVMAPFVDGLSSRRASALAALEHGRAVVSTRGHLYDAQVFEDAPVCITPYNGDSFAAAVLDLLANPDRRRSLGQQAAAFARDTFGWDRIAQRLVTPPTGP